MKVRVVNDGNFIARCGIPLYMQEEAIMNSTPDSLERPPNPTHFNGDGLYDSTGVRQDSSLRVQLGEHLDGVTRNSLRNVEQSASSLFDFAKRNPIPTLLAVGTAIALLAALSRGRRRY